MVTLDFLDSALVIVGHGASLDPDAAAAVHQHAAELRRRHIFAVVREAFWKQGPRLLDVLPTLACRRVFVAPFFLSEGYFCERVIPEALGFTPCQDSGWNRVQAGTIQALFYCKAVGTHPEVKNVTLSRAQEVVERFPFPRSPRPAETSLFVAGHGTQRDENSRGTVERVVTQIGASAVYADVHGVYLEESPRIGSCYELAQTGNIVLVPFFTGEGPHVKKDIPVELGQPERLVRQRLDSGQAPWQNPTEKNGKLVWYGRPVGTAPRMADVVLERVREAAGWPGTD